MPGGTNKDLAKAGATAERGNQQRWPAMEAYEKIKRIWEETLEDLRKAEGGNKAAGVRVRKLMQDIKAAAQEVREKVLDLGKTEEKA